MHATIQELLSGVLRFFPNSMIVTLMILGIATGRLPWILVSIGGLLIVILTLTIQYILGKTIISSGAMPSAAVLEACALLPIASGATYSALPSVWIATTSFFATFVFVNAVRIYTQVPAPGVKTSKDGIPIPVQQRKGMGMISMLAVSILFFMLVIPRWWTSCETMLGLLLGLAIGVGGGYGWWQILNACGSAIYPDIHGVQAGLTPGALRSGPVACSPKKVM
jgi:hypothetical protein